VFWEKIVYNSLTCNGQEMRSGREQQALLQKLYCLSIRKTTKAAKQQETARLKAAL